MRVARTDCPVTDDFTHLPTPEPLSPCETEILRLLASGFRNREVAEAFSLAEGTVKNVQPGAA